MTIEIKHAEPVAFTTGSEKQIAWAQDIRARMLKEAEAVYEPPFQAAIAAGELTPEQENAIRMYNRAYRSLGRYINAEFWIKKHTLLYSGDLVLRAEVERLMAKDAEEQSH
jgi:hypothetical protein